jgi:hypothetical protein
VVELLMASSSDGAKQSPQEKEIVARLLGCVGQGHGAVHNGVEVGLQGNSERKKGLINLVHFGCVGQGHIAVHYGVEVGLQGIQREKG